MSPLTYGTEQFTDQINNTTAHSTSNVLRENPGPALLVGAGLAWFFYEQEKRRTRSLATRVQNQAARVQNQASSLMNSAKTSIGEAQESGAEALESSREAISKSLHAAEGAIQHQANRAVDQMVALKEENPIMLGVLAAITGFAFGLMMPSTRTENRLLGPARDQVLENAQQAATELKNTAVESLEYGRDAVKETLTSASEEIKDVVTDTVAEVKSSLSSELNKDKATDDSAKAMGGKF